MSVRNALGDQEAATLGRRRGVPGKLSLLKAMVNECENFLNFPLSVYFLNESWRQVFLTASYSKEHDCASIRPTIYVSSLEEMPFWVKRSKKKGMGKQTSQELGSQIVTTTTTTSATNTTAAKPEAADKLRCYTCNFTAADDETTVVCDQCSNMFHEFCLEGLARGGAVDTKW